MTGAAIAVRRLNLTAFRNYSHLTLETDARPVVLTGANGAGKTNLLEAISLLVPGRGLRSAGFDTLTRHGSTQPWAVAADVDSLSGPARIGTGLQPAGDAENGRATRVVRVDQTHVPVTTLSDYVACLWLTPAMDGLFTGPAGERRRFMDRLVLARDRGHASRGNRFERLMRQRNRLLADSDPDARHLTAIEADMASEAVAIAAARRVCIARLNEAREARGHDDLFPAFAAAIEGEIETGLDTASATDVEDTYRATLQDARGRDAAAGRTLNGPHRSDLAVTHMDKGMPAAMASTGEQKALLIGLTLAQADEVAALAGDRPPLILLDEIAAHLDDLRRAALYDRLLALGAQAWMTGTERTAFADLGDAAQGFDVSAGAVAPWS